MGASTWVYLTVFQEDEQAALDDLRGEVFARNAEYYQDEGIESPAELAESGWLEEEPAHSVLDVERVVRCEPDSEQAGDVRVVEGEEVVELFGAVHPTREVVERVVQRCGDGWVPPFDRGSGCCTAIYAGDGSPEAWCFWGRSGD